MSTIYSDNAFELRNRRVALPEEARFYVRKENAVKNLNARDNGQIRIDRSLKDLVEKSDLFREEDKKRFVFE